MDRFSDRRAIRYERRSGVEDTPHLFCLSNRKLKWDSEHKELNTVPGMQLAFNQLLTYLHDTQNFLAFVHKTDHITAITYRSLAPCSTSLAHQSTNIHLNWHSGKLLLGGLWGTLDPTSLPHWPVVWSWVTPILLINQGIYKHTVIQSNNICTIQLKKWWRQSKTKWPMMIDVKMCWLLKC